MNIIQKITPCYYSEKTDKTHILLHHTAGGNISGALDTWAKNKNGKVGAHFVIGRAGEIVQAIPLDNWAYTLGLQKDDNWRYKSLWEKGAISIELVNWGFLAHTNTGWKSYAGTTINSAEVIQLEKPFRGYNAYQDYTAAQIKALGDLLLYIQNTKNIPLRVENVNSFFDNKIQFYRNLSPESLGDKQTIFTHVNFRSTGKWDCFPSPGLIALLREIEKKK